jgi:hypothetical protein
MFLHNLQCKFHFRILVEWIDTKANIVSDLLSRLAIAESLRPSSRTDRFPCACSYAGQGSFITGLADDVRTLTREAFAESTLSTQLMGVRHSLELPVLKEAGAA